MPVRLHHPRNELQPNAVGIAFRDPRQQSIFFRPWQAHDPRAQLRAVRLRRGHGATLGSGVNEVRADPHEIGERGLCAGKLSKPRRDGWFGHVVQFALLDGEQPTKVQQAMVSVGDLGSQRNE